MVHTISVFECVRVSGVCVNCNLNVFITIIVRPPSVLLLFGRYLLIVWCCCCREPCRDNKRPVCVCVCVRASSRVQQAKHTSSSSSSTVAAKVTAHCLHVCVCVCVYVNLTHSHGVRRAKAGGCAEPDAPFILLFPFKSALTHTVGFAKRSPPPFTPSENCCTF